MQEKVQGTFSWSRGYRHRLHKGLPTVSFSKQKLEVMEFYPYKKMFEEGLASVMVAHLNVPSLSPNQIILFYFL
jgi:hypothetical protein